MKGYSTSLINDIKTIRYFTSSRMATLKKKYKKEKKRLKKKRESIGKDMEKLEPHALV